MNTLCDGDEAYYSSGSEPTVKQEDFPMSSNADEFVPDVELNGEYDTSTNEKKELDAESRPPWPGFLHCPTVPTGELPMPPDSIGHAFSNDGMATFSAGAVGYAMPYAPPPAYFDMGLSGDSSSSALADSPPCFVSNLMGPGDGKSWTSDSIHPPTLMSGFAPQMMAPSFMACDSAAGNPLMSRHPMMMMDASALPNLHTVPAPTQGSETYYDGPYTEMDKTTTPILMRGILPPPPPPLPLQRGLGFNASHANNYSKRGWDVGYPYEGSVNVSNPTMESCSDTSTRDARMTPSAGLAPWVVSIDETGVQLEPAGIVSAELVPQNQMDALVHYQKLLIEKMKDDGADPTLVEMIEKQFQGGAAPSSVSPPIVTAKQDMDEDCKTEDSISNDEIVVLAPPLPLPSVQSELVNEKDSVVSDNPSDLTCPICQKQYKTLKYLRAHAKVHSDLAPACDVCGKKFATQDKVRRHRTIHTGLKPYKCEFCQRAFNRKEHLTKHVRVHTGEKPYVCPTCHRGFTQKGNLNSHLKIHTGERPFLCDACPKTFRLKSHLTTHRRIHTGEKPFSCNHCTKRFSDQSSLSRHRRLHLGNKYKCPFPQCSKEFTDVSNVRRHQRVAHEHISVP